MMDQAGDEHRQIRRTEVIDPVPSPPLGKMRAGVVPPHGGADVIELRRPSVVHRRAGNPAVEFRYRVDGERFSTRAHLASGGRDDVTGHPAVLPQCGDGGLELGADDRVQRARGDLPEQRRDDLATVPHLKQRHACSALAKQLFPDAVIHGALRPAGES